MNYIVIQILKYMFMNFQHQILSLCIMLYFIVPVLRELQHLLMTWFGK